MADPLTLFRQAFTALTDHGPFCWQERLFDRLLRADIPPACNIPTGLGKTSVIPIWLIALASQAERRQMGVPRRLVYIVNRRTVVDQATNVVEQMQQRLLDPDGVLWSAYAETLRSLVQLLRGLAATEEIPLAVSTLRGELADNQEWKADPTRPAIIIGTVDMVGSKLLFSGYGDGRYGRAHNAGLIGQDTLIVHDEAHLTPAFSDLLHGVADAQRKAREPRPIRVMELSATTRDNDGDALQLGPEDEADAIVRQRLDASKELRLHEVEKASVHVKMVELASNHERAAARVLIYVHSPNCAQKIADQLKRRLTADAEHRVALLTGTIRGHERDRLVKANPVYRAMLNRHEQLNRTVYLVSTSAGEVGIDLDADHMACDLTTLDSMIQRLGRVNRCGGPGRVARVDVVAEEGEPKSKDRASGLESAIRATQVLLNRWIDDAHGTLNASPRRLRALVEGLTDNQRNQAFSPKPPVPPLTDILLDAWSLTSVTETMPGRPHVAAYLHGLTNDPPETFVAWRKEVTLLAGANVDDTVLGEWFRTCRVAACERLRDRSDRTKKVLADLFRKHCQEDGSRDFPVVLLDERGKAEWSQLSQVVGEKFDLAYFTVILPVEVGGLNTDGMLDNEAVVPVAHIDVGDEPGIRERRVRTESGDERPFEELLIERQRTEDMAGSPKLVDQYQLVLCQPDEDAGKEGESRSLVLMAVPKESALDGPETAKGNQNLDEHADGVAKQVRMIADALGLEPLIREALIKAGEWHDCGKSRPVWQRYACNTDLGHPLAKSTKYLHGRLLGGYRHEFGSLLDAADERQVIMSPERDLIMHLIAAHHGWARPHFESNAYDPPPTTSARNEEIAVEIMRRFGSLQQRFGRWGLAWLESLLRSADILASQNPSNGSQELKL